MFLVVNTPPRKPTINIFIIYNTHWKPWDKTPFLSHLLLPHYIPLCEVSSLSYFASCVWGISLFRMRKLKHKKVSCFFNATPMCSGISLPVIIIFSRKWVLRIRKILKLCEFLNCVLFSTCKTKLLKNLKKLCWGRKRQREGIKNGKGIQSIVIAFIDFIQQIFIELRKQQGAK